MLIQQSYGVCVLVLYTVVLKQLRQSVYVCVREKTIV